MGKGGKGKGFGGKPSWPEGPPDWVESLGTTMHTCEDQLIVKCTHKRVPQFNARIFLENKEQIGIIIVILVNYNRLVIGNYSLTNFNIISSIPPLR